MAMDKQKYQINSTPFMRRLVSKSTKNGDLQRLKEEYERIKKFNEHIMQVRMRQMRLKRLSRVVELMKNNPTHNAFIKQKSNEEIRAEQIHKARQLGQEFSRQNASNWQLDKIYSRPHKPRNKNTQNSRGNEQYAKIAKRIQYGNMRSHINMTSMPLYKHPRPLVNSTDRINMNQKREVLLRRISYGNNCSHSNVTHAQKASRIARQNRRSLCCMNWIDNVTQTDNRPIISSPETLENSEVRRQPSIVIEQYNYQNEDNRETPSVQLATETSSINLTKHLGTVAAEDIGVTDTELKNITESTNLHEYTNSNTNVQCTQPALEAGSSSNEIFTGAQRYFQQIVHAADAAKAKNSDYDITQYLRTLVYNDHDDTEDTEGHPSAIKTMCRLFQHQYSKLF